MNTYKNNDVINRFERDVEINNWDLVSINLDKEVFPEISENGKTNLLLKNFNINEAFTHRKLLFGVNEVNSCQQYYGVVSKHYVEVPHEELIFKIEDYIYDFADNINYKGKIHEKIDYGDYGKRMFAQYRFDDMKFDIQSVNEVAFNIIIS